MSNKIIFILIALVVVMALGLGVTLFMRNLQNPEEPTPSFEFPGGSTTPPTTSENTIPAADTMSIQNAENATVSIRDFKKDPTVIADPNNAGQYIISGGIEPSYEKNAFSIIYVPIDQSFTVTLLQEPLNESREKAEKELLEKLGIGQSELCALRYAVYVPRFVNDVLAGENLGFSFCPGAIPL
ncbi:hypothetical protein K2X96_00410 [Patescibacteria group bacterium]|nr:hypothetical protein [Patescibacteria group bacterium]